MVFKFKQFQVDQSGCAMKINTDGVLLGALAKPNNPKNILDIGTGTGVIAMMAAQHYPDAMIDAVEIDLIAATTARKNFQESPFSGRLSIYPLDIETYFENFPEKKYDLIISNPPFYLNSLEAKAYAKCVAKHTDKYFFNNLISSLSKQLSPTGECWLILPLPTAEVVKILAQKYGLYNSHTISIHSFASDKPHREIIILSRTETNNNPERFVIYDEPKVYSKQYQECLKDFFTIF